MNQLRQLVLTYFKGIGMGAADVIPGVSGGTIAFITGIYERLINAIKSINFKTLKLFFTGKFKSFWRAVDGSFLLFLIAGIATSFLSLAKLITYLLEHYPILVWSFFFGLIIASTLFVGRSVKWNFKTGLAFVLFTVTAFLVTSPTNAPLASQHELWYIFLCGTIAICAMILPGISGSFILVLLGEYLYILKALTALDLVIIFTFLAGALIGIISFANFLSWLFKHYKMIALASLTGFMFGSLNKIWPWKETLTTFQDMDGIIHPLTQRNILPHTYETLTGSQSQLLGAILLIFIGFILIFSIEFLAEKLKKRRLKGSNV